MKVSLIVAVYKRADFLRLVLESVCAQRFSDFEVIIAEDGQDSAITSVVDDFSSNRGLSISHLTQQDKGFRKNRIFNKAINIASGELLVFIDGDCILHPNFIGEYAKRGRDNLCLFGRRVMLDRMLTDKLLGGVIRHDKLNALSVLFSKSRRKEDAFFFPFRITFRNRGIKGCNFCVPKKTMLYINGFDEDFEAPFIGEDTDIERRLLLAGVTLQCTKFNTVQFHLHHDSGNRTDAFYRNLFLYSEKVKQELYWCENGILKTKSVNSEKSQ